jgi:hypothetical protein
MTSFQIGQSVRFKADGRTGVIVRRVRNHPQWLIELPDGRLTWWWASDIEPT